MANEKAFRFPAPVLSELKIVAFHRNATFSREIVGKSSLGGMGVPWGAFSQVQFEFVQYEPTTGAAVAAAAKKILQSGPQLRMRKCVQGRRPRLGVQHAVHDFGDRVLRRVQHVLIIRPAGPFLRRRFGWFGHIPVNLLNGHHYRGTWAVSM